MKSKNEATNSVSTARQSVFPVTPASAAKEVFVKKLNCGNDANNARTTIAIFMRVADEVSDSLRSFGWEDFWRVAKRYSMDSEDCKRLFSAWVETQIQCGRLEAMPSVYNSDIYLRVGV